jgi:hypothetical protein
MSGGSRGESLVLALQGQPVPSAFASALALTHVLRYPTVRTGRRFDSPLRIQQKAKKPTRGFFTFWWSRGESNPRPQVIYDQFYMRSRFIFVLAAT